MPKDGSPIKDLPELPRLTDRQLAALTFIHRYWRWRRHAPTHREIAAAMGARTTTAAPWIEVLLGKGYLARSREAAHRNLRITPLGLEKLRFDGKL